MSNIDSNVRCPSCQKALIPKVLACEDCGVKVEGPFQLNEFATLPPEDLHFLRIFVRCEGRIREMESALGLSYPTVRARLTDLKNKLSQDPNEAEKTEADTQATAEILELLRAGKLSFDEAMKRIKRSPK